MSRAPTLEQLQRKLSTARDGLNERRFDGLPSAVDDLFDIVEALLVRAAETVPLPLDEKPWPKAYPGPMRHVRIAPPKTIADLTDAEIDRLLPRGHPGSERTTYGTMSRYHFIRRDYELYSPYPEQPALMAIRRKAGI